MSAELSPERFRHAVRSHWAIGNSLHWVLDATMNEDRQRNRTGNGPENLALLRRMALNVARIEPGKDAMRGKLKRAARNGLSVFATARPKPSIRRTGAQRCAVRRGKRFFGDMRRGRSPRDADRIVLDVTNGACV